AVRRSCGAPIVPRADAPARTGAGTRRDRVKSAFVPAGSARSDRSGSFGSRAPVPWLREMRPPSMPADLDFNGERYVPGVAGEIAYEHWHRYAFARQFVPGRRVLDAACGEGYGTALLAAAAAAAIGVDVDP